MGSYRPVAVGGAGGIGVSVDVVEGKVTTEKTLDELMDELRNARAFGKTISMRQLARGAVGMTDRKSEIMCLVLWGVPDHLIEYLLTLAGENELGKITKGCSIREAARRMGIGNMAAHRLMKEAEYDLMAILADRCNRMA